MMHWWQTPKESDFIVISLVYWSNNTVATAKYWEIPAFPRVFSTISKEINTDKYMVYKCSRFYKI